MNSKNNEESGFGLNFDLLTISYLSVFHILGEVD